MVAMISADKGPSGTTGVELALQIYYTWRDSPVDFRGRTAHWICFLRS